MYIFIQPAELRRRARPGGGLKWKTFPLGILRIDVAVAGREMVGHRGC